MNCGVYNIMFKFYQIREHTFYILFKIAKLKLRKIKTFYCIECCREADDQPDNSTGNAGNFLNAVNK